jgi:hypothetical protein
MSTKKKVRNPYVYTFTHLDFGGHTHQVAIARRIVELLEKHAEDTHCIVYMVSLAPMQAEILCIRYARLSHFSQQQVCPPSHALDEGLQNMGGTVGPGGS